MKNYELSCAVDLDGVLANFSGRIQEITGQVCETLPKGKLWAAVERYNREVAPFFETLDKMPDADRLWSFITQRFNHVFILTATGWTPRNGADQKTKWVHDRFGSQINVKVVTSGSLKAMYATPRIVLVDDTTKAIDPWIKAGGIGVLHKNAEDSISQLEKILAGQY